MLDRVAFVLYSHTQVKELGHIDIKKHLCRKWLVGLQVAKVFGAHGLFEGTVTDKHLKGAGRKYVQVSMSIPLL